MLGPVEVTEGGQPVRLGGYRQRLVLALLLARAGRTASTDWLVDAVWGAYPPRTARKTLQVYIARLRGALGDDAIVRHEGGYALDLRDDELDIREFEDQAGRGHEVLAEQPEAARRYLLAALALWRGPPFGEMADEPALVSDVQRLQEQRLVCLEDRIEADQRLGHASGGVAELEALVADHPERSRLQGALMLALYRGGRGAEALAVYEGIRTSLGERLGADPDPALLRLHERILTQDPALQAPPAPAHVDRTDLRNPYKGLRAFTVEDAGDFFGRGEPVERLAEALIRRTFVVVTGASGCGKSSVVRAGLVPTLVSRGWHVLTMVPGAYPFESLRDAVSTTSAAQVRWHSDDLDVLRTLQAVSADDQRVLLVVDQVEELLTQAGTSARQRFLANLATVADDPAGRCAVLLTVRADFLDRALADPTIGEHVADALVTIAPLGPAEVAEAAVGPAARVGASLEPELVGELVADMADQPGALPLFEYALTELFDLHSGGVLTAAQYRRLGGLRGALARRAETTLESLEPDEKTAAESAFLRLVTVVESGAATRRRVRRAELESIDASVPRVLDAFDRARLLTFDRHPISSEPTVEIAHEALISEWPRLRAWVDSAQDDLRRRRMLNEAVQEWVDADRDDGFLISASRLASYDDWPHTPAVQPTREEAEFLARSREERRARHREKRRATQRLRGLVVATTVIALIASGLAVLAVERAGEAEAAADAARAREMSQASAAVLDSDSDLALLLAMEAVRLAGDTVPEATSALHAAVSQDRLLLSVHEGWDAELLPAGRVLVGGETARVVDVATGATVSEIETPATARLVTASADGRVAGVFSANQTVSEGGQDRWQSVATIGLHDLTGDRSTALLAAEKADFTSALVLSEDGERLARQSAPNAGGLTVTVTETGDRAARRLITPDPDRASRPGIAFTDGAHSVLHAIGTRLHALDVRVDEWRLLATTDEPMRDVAVLADGSILTAHDDGSLRQWSPSGEPLATTTVADRPLTALDVDTAAGRAVTGTDDGHVALWDIRSATPQRLSEFTGSTVGIVEVDVRESQVAGVDRTGRVRVWDTGDTSELGVWDGGGPVAISPNGGMLAVAAGSTSPEPIVYVRALPGGEEQAMVRPADAPSAVEGTAFCDDSSCLATTFRYPDSTWGRHRELLQVTDLASGQPVSSVRTDVLIQGDPALAGPLAAVAVCSDTSTAVVRDWTQPATGDGSSIWPPDPRLVQLSLVDGCGLSVDLSSDGSRYAVVTSRPLAGATVYDTASGRQVVAVTHPPGQRGSVRFSPDDRSIVTTGADGAARVWDVTTGEQAVALAGDGGEVLEAAWSPDGAQVVTSHLDGVVRVWSVEDGRLRSEIGEYSRAPSIALSPDGRRLATSADGVVHLWTTDTEELLELAAAKVTRSLTEGECERYGIDPCPTA